MSEGIVGNANRFAEEYLRHLQIDAGWKGAGASSYDKAHSRLRTMFIEFAQRENACHDCLHYKDAMRGKQNAM